MTRASRSRDGRPLLTTVPGIASVVARGATTVLVASLVLVAPAAGAGTPATSAPTSQAASAPATAPTTAPSPALAARRTTDCADALVVGVDGNGQGRKGSYGKVVGKVVNKIKARAKQQGRSVELVRVRVNTPGAQLLVAGRSRGLPTTAALSKKQVNRWKKPVGKGVTKTRALVNSRLEGCTQQQVVLVGYAQGAAVVHRVAQDLDDRDALTNVAAVVTVSDPWRTKGSSAGRPLGQPAAGLGSEGVVTKVQKSAGDVPAGTDTFRVVPVCHRGDLVCNPNRTRVGTALRTALSYSGKASRAPMKQAAELAWQQVSLWPVPASGQLMATAGQPISQQLTVRGGSPGATPARWTALSLPAGLSLSPEGVLSGAVATPGIYEVAYQVAGVAPVTSAKSGTMLLNVKAESGALSAGGQSSCEVRTDGTAWCWGRNDFGQLGDGTRTLRINRTQVLGTDWARVATGGSFTCGVQRAGTLWCWGLNNFGQLGGADKEMSLVPRQVGTDTAWKEVAASWSHACATKADGSLWCWGQNVHGQLGNGGTSLRSTGPVRVPGDQQWTSVSAGGWHTCGATASGAAYCWGNNAFGQLGDGTTTLRVRPTKVAGDRSFAQLSTTWGRTCGVMSSGAMACWGDNAEGELGNGTRTDSSVPVDVSDGGRTWAQVATGNTGTCAAETNGQVWCWGDNRYGQLGPAVGAGYSTTPVPAGFASTGGAVSAGWNHVCGVSGASASCWGGNEVGQHGSGAMTPPAMPARPKATYGRTTPMGEKEAWSSTPREIAQVAVGGRPSVSARTARRRSASFGLMSFNVLGSQHTSPSGARPAFAPGRVRTEWSRQLINVRDASLVGLQESQPDQIDSFDVATRGAFSFYPGNSLGYPGAPQSVMWRDSDWEFVWGNTVEMPFMRESRPQPVVRLRHRATGSEVYWINLHLSPGKMEKDRDRGLKITVDVIKDLQGDGLPILLTGDFNEHREAFCKIVGKTDLKAAQGGSFRKGRCKPPRHMRVDWIFASKGTFKDTAIDQSPRVRRTTDHAVISTRFTVQ